MQKLLNVIKSNFAIIEPDTLKCHHKFEDAQNEAMVMFVGMTRIRNNTVEIARFLKIGVGPVVLAEGEYKQRSGKRFEIKRKLVENGMRL